MRFNSWKLLKLSLVTTTGILKKAKHLTSGNCDVSKQDQDYDSRMFGELCNDRLTDIPTAPSFDTLMYLNKTQLISN